MDFKNVIMTVSADYLRSAVMENNPMLFLARPILSGELIATDKPCLIINKNYARENPAIIEELGRKLNMVKATAGVKKQVVGQSICSKVDVYGVDPALFGLISTDTFEVYAKENTLHSCNPQYQAVAAI